MTTDIPIPTLPESRAVSVGEHAGGHSAISSLQDARFYDALYTMTAAAIEAAFSGNDGRLREAPDAWHRAADTQ